MKFRDPAADSIVGLVDSYLRYNSQNNNHRGFEHYHPSAFGSCLRLMQYQRYSERGYIPTYVQTHDQNQIRISDVGHSMHDRWRSYFENLNVLRGYWRCNNIYCGIFDNNGNEDKSISFSDVKNNQEHFLKLRRNYGRDHLQGSFKPEQCICGSTRFRYDEIDVISEELNFKGHCDMILDFSSKQFDPEKYTNYQSEYSYFKLDALPKNPIVVDMKTANNYAFQDVAKGNSKSLYLIQLMIYANVLDCEYGVLIYENKDNQKTVSFRVNRDADTKWLEVNKQALAMNDMVEVLDDNGEVQHLLPPPRAFTKDDRECNYCPYREICHNSSVWEDNELDAKRSEFYGTLL
jgi:PD-(D/E)XK nuclease superfamily